MEFLKKKTLNDVKSNIQQKVNTYTRDDFTHLALSKSSVAVNWKFDTIGNNSKQNRRETQTATQNEKQSK